MKNNENVEILFVEDSIDDAKLAIRELKKSNIANSIFMLMTDKRLLTICFVRAITPEGIFQIGQI